MTDDYDPDEHDVRDESMSATTRRGLLGALGVAGLASLGSSGASAQLGGGPEADAMAEYRVPTYRVPESDLDSPGVIGRRVEITSGGSTWAAGDQLVDTGSSWERVSAGYGSVNTGELSGDITNGEAIQSLLGSGLEVDDEGNLHAPERAVLTEYLMEAGSGDTLSDDGVLNNDGTIDAATWVEDADSPSGYVLDFDGSSAKVTAPSQSAYDNDEWTVSMWVNPDNLSSNTHLFGFYDTENNDRSWRVNYHAFRNSITIDVSTDGTSTNGIRTHAAENPPNDTWTCLTARYDGQTFTLFKNKQKIAQQDSTDIFGHVAPLALCGYPNDGEHFDGSASTFKMWAQAITDGEIRQHVEDTNHGINLDPDVKLPQTLGGVYWHGQPSSVHKDGVTISGYVNGSGDIYAMKYDHSSGEWATSLIEPQTIFDDHILPIFHIRESDDCVIVFYARGSRTDSGVPEYYISDSPLDIDFTNKQTLDQYSRSQKSYPKPVQFSDGTIRLQIRNGDDGNYPYGSYVESTDGGESFGELNDFIRLSTYTDNAPDWNYTMLDEHDDVVHYAVNPKEGGSGGFDSKPKNIYYVSYHHDTGEYKLADGTVIGTTADEPFSENDFEVVYDIDATGNNPAWIHDCVADENGVPHITFSTYPNLESDDSGDNPAYKWAYWTGSSWEVKTVVDDAGAELTNNQPLYTGTCRPSMDDPTKLWLSQQVNGEWEIQTAETNDGGDTWAFTDITSGSEQKHIRPFPVKNANSEIPAFWMRGYYADPLKDYQTFMETPLDGKLSDTFEYHP